MEGVWNVWSVYSLVDQHRARARNQKLITINVDGCCQTPRTGGFQIQAAVPDECAAELCALVERWQEEGKV